MTPALVQHADLHDLKQGCDVKFEQLFQSVDRCAVWELLLSDGSQRIQEAFKYEATLCFRLGLRKYDVDLSACEQQPASKEKRGK